MDAFCFKPFKIHLWKQPLKDVCKVQNAFKAVTKRMVSKAHLVVIPVLESNHFGTVCVVHPEDMMLEFVVRPTTYVVVIDSIAGYFNPSK